MQHVGIAEPEYAAVLAASCPECQHPMVLVRVLPALGQQPPLAAFYCKPCQFASTVRLKE